MKISTLEEIYIKLVFESDDDVVKVSLVIYTKLPMMGKAKKKCNVEKDLFDDVEDLDYFNNIDWEHEFGNTIKGLLIALKDKVDMCIAKGGKNPKYHLKYNLIGFLVAFQVIFQTNRMIQSQV